MARTGSEDEDVARGTRVLAWAALLIAGPVVLVALLLTVIQQHADSETEGLLLLVLLLWVVPAAGAAALAVVALRLRARLPRLAVGLAIGALILALMDLVSFVSFWFLPG